MKHIYEDGRFKTKYIINYAALNIPIKREVFILD